MTTNTANVSRIIAGTRPLSAGNRRALARIFQCAEADLVHAIGAPIPPRADILSLHPGGDGSEGINRRLNVILSALGVPRLEDLVPFILAGDYSQLPPLVARRFKEILEGVESREDDPT